MRDTATASRRKHTILTVTRDTGTRELIKFMLRTVGFNTAEAVDSPSAIETIHRSRPDLVILDQDLDRSNCLATCFRMRGLDATHAAPILILADRIAELDPSVARSAGVAGFVPKPVRMPDLVESVGLLLPWRRERKSRISLPFGPQRHTR
ncbi:hypothetical protein Q0Z83_021860 [Actinoplanes sichuanensis]|uniref:PleD family two-component system response regulator n=1 Tax=Actinoplanes sichuanensis TaxID=512349 RepID=A0ABW4AI75_9ACTN|nr:response regulator [Actinoplanes sichuanensis]BEL03995.1 hypothetical protein Q0Z83_021860 [Actinoplanes sichuanensis]